MPEIGCTSLLVALTMYLHIRGGIRCWSGWLTLICCCVLEDVLGRSVGRCMVMSLFWITLVDDVFSGCLVCLLYSLVYCFVVYNSSFIASQDGNPPFDLGFIRI